MNENVQKIGLESHLEKTFKYITNLNRIKKRLQIAKSSKDKKNLRNELMEQGKLRNEYVLDIYRKTNIFFTTLIGAADYELNSYLTKDEKIFDCVIIDEAAQALEAACLISILKTEK
jgi:superfamily I DNA and/or RNA helicase